MWWENLLKSGLLDCLKFWTTNTRNSSSNRCFNYLQNLTRMFSGLPEKRGKQTTSWLYPIQERNSFKKSINGNPRTCCRWPKQLIQSKETTRQDRNICGTWFLGEENQLKIVLPNFCGTMRVHLQEINSHKPILFKIGIILLNKVKIRSR